jgi:hypothetical protein
MVGLIGLQIFTTDFSMYTLSIRTGFLNQMTLCRLALPFLILIAIVPQCLFSGNAASAEPVLTEYEVKAAYVFNFAKFVDWPSTAFSAKNSPIIIGIIGNDEFGTLLGNIVKAKTIQEHTIAVRQLKWPSDLSACHIVFIGASEQKQVKQITDSLQDRPVLTITEAEEGVQSKGIMNLLVEGGKVQFEIDVASAEKAHLQISSKLLRLARGYTGKNQRK